MLGVCWWQCNAWTEAADTTIGERPFEAFDHVVRLLRIGLWARIGLLATGVGSVAFLVGAIVSNLGSETGGSRLFWPIYVVDGASSIATIGLSWVGCATGGRLGQFLDRFEVEPDGDA